MFNESRGFCVNILSEQQKELAKIFSSPSINRFDGIDWIAGAVGNPVINGSCSSFDCEKEHYINAGDHVVMIGRVMEFSFNSKSPLGYSRGAYVSAG